CFPVPLSIPCVRFSRTRLNDDLRGMALRGPGVANGSHQLEQSLLMQPCARPEIGLSRAKVAALALDEQALEPPFDVAVDLSELLGGVPGPEVVAPSAQDRVQFRDHLADVLDPAATATIGLDFDLGSNALHRAQRWPAVQVVATDAALQQPPGHPRPEVP